MISINLLSLHYLTIFSPKRMTDEEKKAFIRDFTLWQQEGLNIDAYHCLFINFGMNIKLENPQIRRVIMIFS